MKKVILDAHLNRRADAGKRVHHQPDQRTVAQPDERIGFDGIEQGARLFGGEELGATDGVGRIGGNRLAGNQPIKSNSMRSQVLLHGGSRVVLLLLLGVRGHVDCLEGHALADAVGLALVGNCRIDAR